MAIGGPARRHAVREGPDAEAATRTVAAARTRPGAIIGTVAYMSPEQASGRAVDARSDIFSFGVVLYELLAGRPPFAGPTSLEVLQRIQHQPAAPLPEAVPPAFVSGLMRTCRPTVEFGDTKMPD